MAHAASHLEYSSLPGTKIRSGCVKMPAFKSRFCEDHKERSYSCQPNQDNKSSSENTSESGEVIKLLINKRTTRMEIFYQLLRIECVVLGCLAWKF